MKEILTIDLNFKEKGQIKILSKISVKSEEVSIAEGNWEDIEEFDDQQQNQDLEVVDLPNNSLNTIIHPESQWNNILQREPVSEQQNSSN